MNEYEIDLSDVPYSHIHEWRVCGRVPRAVFEDDSTGERSVHGPMIYVRCSGCGAVGVIRDPSPAELRRAHKPYRWFAHQRLTLILVPTANGPEGTSWVVQE